MGHTNGPYTDLSGQGLAFVLRSAKDFSDALPSQYLGLVNSTNDGNATNHLLAIELDTIMTMSSMTLTTTN